MLNRKHNIIWQIYVPMAIPINVNRPDSLFKRQRLIELK